MPYQLPDLPYDFGALEPHIDAKTMEIHHDKHHGGYVSKVNDALADTKFEGKPIEEVLRNIDDVPEAIRQNVINNGGGHANHTLFWQIMTPGASGGTPGTPGGAVGQAIEKTFGGFDAFKDQFSNAAATRFGSGWSWLVVDGAGQLQVYSTKNQDSPFMQGHTPILGLDVWEHAYYLKYQNRRPEYIKEWWNLVNWSKVNELFEGAG